MGDDDDFTLTGKCRAILSFREGEHVVPGRVSRSACVLNHSARDTLIFEKSRHHLEILIVRRVTWSTFRTEDAHVSGGKERNLVPQDLFIPM